MKSVRASSWRSYRPPAPVAWATSATHAAVRVLGLDPGSRVTGYGVLDVAGSATRYVTSGCIAVGRGEFAARLRDIYVGVAAIVAEHRPDELAVERVFVHRNPDSALKLGQARGAALCAAYANGAQLHQYTPREVKQAVAGTGSADKEQIQHMVKLLLNLDGRLAADAADALAIALCHAHSRALRVAVSGPRL
jgi:crossover junction endodeoxyribonuclease RuvC